MRRKLFSGVSVVVVATIIFFFLCQSVVGLALPNDCDDEVISAQLSDDNEIVFNLDPDGSASEMFSEDAAAANRRRELFKKVFEIMDNNPAFVLIHSALIDIYNMAKDHFPTPDQIPERVSEVASDVHNKVSDVFNKAKNRIPTDKISEKFSDVANKGKDHLPTFDFDEISRKFSDAKEAAGRLLPPSKLYSADYNNATNRLPSYGQMSSDAYNATAEYPFKFDQTSLEHHRVYKEIAKALNISVAFIIRNPWIIIDIIIIVAPYEFAFIRLLRVIGFTYPGIRRGSLAARWMAYYGGKVAANSRFALLQSLGATLGRALL